MDCICRHGVGFLHRMKNRGICSITATSQEDSLQSRKKKVAIWVGYVGTAYKGLQLHPGQPTIEGELETAIYKAGGILESNYGHHKKVGWARSSRTDKGVHSLCTVISMKMEVPSDAWKSDAAGMDIADNINAHLPPSIWIFGVIPVSKTFRPRIACSSRSYEYFLPSTCIGINSRLSKADIKQRLEQFRRRLKMFEGEHPFHNYTIRRMYRESREEINWRTRSPIQEDVTDGSSSSDEEVIDMEGVRKESLSSGAYKGGKYAYWLHEPDSTDRIKARHFRRILSCCCGDLEKLGDSSIVRVKVTGASFMVHQIRKMVGTAVAVTRNLLPEDTIGISLCRHSRVVLPIAPPHGLLLSSSEFTPRSKSAAAHAISLSKAGCQKREQFWMECVAPEIARVVDDAACWKAWITALDEYCRLPEEEVSEVRNALFTYKTRRVNANFD